MDTITSKITLRPGPLRRLQAMQLQLQGARDIAQGTVDRFEELKRRVDAALTEACADEGMTIIPGQQQSVDVDWDTGEVSLSVEQSPNGHAATPTVGMERLPAEVGDG